MKKYIFTLFTAISLSLLSACGGGSSSGGPVVITVHDGVYAGQQTIIVTAPDGEVLDDQTFSFDMTVFESGVTIFDPSYSAEGDIVNNAYTAITEEFNSSGGEITCRVVFVYEGVVNDGITRGTIGGTYICSLISDPSNEAIFPITGSYEGVRGVGVAKSSSEVEINFAKLRSVF